MKDMNKEINILDTTLRDGSYAINYSFTTNDIMTIGSKLESVGINYIEIGHGVGLSGSNKGYGKAVQTDEEYLEVAQSTFKTSKYGMFCIPGIAELKDIKLAKKYDMEFIRVGTDICRVEESEEFIKTAKSFGMMVMANYMKSYTASPEEFAEKAKLSEKYGADVVYIVDSAGCMFNRNIKEYYEAIRKVSNINIGFHGHNNLGMAISNSLEAVEMGISFVDSSLQGLGRSAGNAATEILIAALIKSGYNLNIDLLELLNVGQKYVQPLVNNKGIMQLDVVSGFAEFHSSYMAHIQKCSSKYMVDPASLIIELCKVDKVNLDEKVLDEIAQKLTKREDLYLGKYKFNTYIGGEQNE